LPGQRSAQFLRGVGDELALPTPAQVRLIWTRVR
jgi:hypothetical protein